MRERVLLVYDADCPNVEAARRALREALGRAGLEPRWEEVERAAAPASSPLRGYGSPTILVDGVDVGGEPGDACASACRVYPAPAGGFTGVPPVARIAEALGRGERRTRSRSKPPRGA